MKNNITSEDIATLEASGLQAGYMDSDGYFTQSDLEFELDLDAGGSLANLQAHLISGGLDLSTAHSLKGYVTGQRPHVFPFKGAN